MTRRLDPKPVLRPSKFAHFVLRTRDLAKSVAWYEYYEDPDGNRVEFQVDNFETKAELEAFVASPVFEKNPIGVPFDPEKLIARYEQGDPIEELVQQGSA